jgi:hypothetical protein
MKKQTGYKITSALAVAAIVLSPVVASAATTNSTVTATVATVISVTSSGTVAIPVTPTAGGAEGTAANDTVTVTNNSNGGYDLTLANSDATTTLSGPASATLAASAGTFASPIALANNTWGYRLTGFTANTYAGVPASGSAQTLKSTSSYNASADPTVVSYNVKVDLSKPAGAYSDTVTYTATAKP